MSAGAGRIGPNALLQLIPVLEREGGAALREAVFRAGGVTTEVPRDAMIPEGPVAAVHQALRRLAPERAPALSRLAGLRTADYILAHRIPRPAQMLLRVLPRRVAAGLLGRAIARNAWTFAGSGRFAVVAPVAAAERGFHTPPSIGSRTDGEHDGRPPWDIFEQKNVWVTAFEISDNPIVRGERSRLPVCAWHAAVFERLFAALVDPRVRVRETACCACGDPACRFEIALGGRGVAEPSAVPS